MGKSTLQIFLVAPEELGEGLNSQLNQKLLVIATNGKIQSNFFLFGLGEGLFMQAGT